jgi:CheY-like chemotaxis protein
MNQTVLIIDDSENDILITRRVFSRIDRDIRAEAALSGEAGIEFLRRSRVLPALILLDLKMLGMSGFDTLRLIRADERLKEVPVVIVTTSALAADRAEALALGASSFLSKSIDVDKFTRDMTHLWERWLKP